MPTVKEEALKMLEAARRVPPWTPDNLWNYIASYYGLKIPRLPVCPGHVAPFDFVVGSYFDTTDGWSHKDKGRYFPHGDCVVWACRSGGKTMLGAVSARLKALFRSGCGIRILGGSSDQAKKMYEHVSGFDHRTFSDTVKGNSLQERTHYKNGSNIEILMASQTSVRGPHVPVLMLDEVDEFREEIYRAALPIAQSKGGVMASIEEFSTAHKPDGIMQRLVKEAAASGKVLYKWCIFEVLQQCKLPCTQGNPRSKCYEMVKYDQLNQPHRFSEVCAGRAKRSRGYYRIEDLWQKFSHPIITWEGFSAEYLCELPNTENALYPMLSQQHHMMRDWPEWRSAGWKLIMGADAGPTNTWAVWAASGRAYPQDDFETVIILSDFRTNQRTAPSDSADMILAEHQRRGYPKAEALFMGNAPPDQSLADEINKGRRRTLMFTPSARQPDGRRCVHVDRESAEVGFERVGNMLMLRPNPDGKPRPGLAFCSSARATFDSCANSQHGEGGEDHGAAAVRYAIRGWELKRYQFLNDRGSGMVIAVG